MSIDSLLNRYALTAKSEGKSPATIEHTTRVVKFFTEFLGGIADVRTVTGDDLRRFILALQQKDKWSGLVQAKPQKITGTSVNTYIRGIKAFWHWLETEGIIKQNPLAKVPTPKPAKKLPKVLTEDELARVFKACQGNDRDMAIVQLLADSGMRLGELVNLDYTDFNGKDDILKVRGKVGERPVFITDDTRAAIELYTIDARPAPKGTNRLFLTYDGYPLTTDRVQKILARLGKKAGLSTRLAPHKIRHTTATMMLKAGANLETVRRTLGHRQISTTEEYLHLTDRDVAEAHRQYSPVGRLTRKPGRS
jgi:site-specific recombinase XerD